ncbi:hypothetical protein BI330_06400 [Mycobacterium sp. CBMA 623]|nr:hypothetical protein [Mycobacteroides sp. CBMA 326]
MRLVALAAIALILAGCTHQSEPTTTELGGTYTFVADGTQLTIDGEPRKGGTINKSTWQIEPCGPACSRVTSSLGWTADLHLIDNKWQATRELPPLECSHGAEKSTLTYVLDASTLTGTVANSLPCNKPGSAAVIPAKLTKA